MTPADKVVTPMRGLGRVFQAHRVPTEGFEDSAPPYHNRSKLVGIFRARVIILVARPRSKARNPRTARPDRRRIAYILAAAKTDTARSAGEEHSPCC